MPVVSGVRGTRQDVAVDQRGERVERRGRGGQAAGQLPDRTVLEGERVQEADDGVQRVFRAPGRPAVEKIHRTSNGPIHVLVIFN